MSRDFRRFVTEEEYDKDIRWANKNFENLDAYNKRFLNEFDTVEHNFGEFAKANNYNEKRIKRLERSNNLNSLGLITFGILVLVHEKRIKDIYKRLDRVESAVRYGRERAEENEI